MKLSNWQADALIAKMRQNFNEKNKKKIADAKKNQRKTFLAKAQGMMKVYRTIPAELRRLMYNDRSLTVDKIVNSLSPNNKLPEFSSSDAREKLLIASFDAKNVDDLKSKLGIQ